MDFAVHIQDANIVCEKEGKIVQGRQPRAVPMMFPKMDRRIHECKNRDFKYLTRKEYGGVRHSVVQKTTEPQEKHIFGQNFVI